MDWQLKDRYTIRFLSCLHSEKYSVLLNISNNITVDQWSKFRFKYCLTLTGAQKYLTFSHPLQTSGKSTDMAKKKKRENLSCEITKSALILAQKDVFVLDKLLTEKIGFRVSKSYVAMFQFISTNLIILIKRPPCLWLSAQNPLAHTEDSLKQLTIFKKLLLNIFKDL